MREAGAITSGNQRLAPMSMGLAIRHPRGRCDEDQPRRIEERLARIENFIWTHRHLIHSYFVRRGKARAAEAQEVSDTLKGIQEMMI